MKEKKSLVEEYLKHTDRKLGIDNLWIMEKGTGLSLFHSSRIELQIDNSLFTAFLSAMDTFAKETGFKRGIESIEMGRYEFIYFSTKKLVFISAVDKSRDISIAQEQLKDIRLAFLEHFEDELWTGYLKELQGAIDDFESFQENFDNLMENWDKKEEQILNEKIYLIEINTKIFSSIIQLFLGSFGLLFGVEKLKNKLQEVVLNKVGDNIRFSKFIIRSDGIDFNLENFESINTEELRKNFINIDNAILTFIIDEIGIKGSNPLFRKILPNIIEEWKKIKKVKLDDFYFHGLITRCLIE